MHVLINSIYIYLLLGLVVSAVEAIIALTRNRAATLFEMLIYLVMAVLLWPYVLYAIRRR